MIQLRFNLSLIDLVAGSFKHYDDYITDYFYKWAMPR